MRNPLEKRLFDYLTDQLAQNPLEQAFGSRIDGQWQHLSTAEMVDLTNRLSTGLLRMGLKPGDKLATVVYKTTPQWVALDFAMLQIGVLNIPMYPTISPREYAYILNESEARFCVVGDGDLFEKLQAAKPNCPKLEAVFCFNEHPGCRNYTELIADEVDEPELQRLRDGIKPDDLCTIIYTSGTTGDPKGVMLTHRNIVYNVETMRKLIPIKAGQKTLSFLPVSHIFERAVVYAYTAYGASVYFTTTDNLGGDDGDLKSVAPHFFSTVPRLLEKVFEKIMAKGYELKGFKRALFFWAMSMADTWEFDFKPKGFEGVRWMIADKLIFSKWRAALGGNIMGIITGASACPMRIMRIFNAAGISVREGYGLTEAAPAFSFSRFEPGGARLGTVGRLFEGVNIRIEGGSEYREGEGEIVATSPGVMLGYFKQPEKTAEVLREENGRRWLLTGDIGMVIPAADGGEPFLKITDRKKELLKTSGGKYVAPAPIEAAFKEHFLVEQAMVVGENLKFVSALIVPSADGLKEWCGRHSIPWTGLNDALTNPKVLERYQMLVDRINPHFAKFEQIKKFALLPDPWEAVKKDGTDAEMTPTLKLKRRVIMEKFKSVIDGMYA
ncbi:MAG: long-chain fatty acid--CoA ligase [Saprospiraceae bacterium]|nr:long-chain fatty acid--CoA ligase [Saprospiraceae bacterium]